MVDIRSNTEFKMKVSAGEIEGWYDVHKFGANNSVGASSMEDVTAAGIINWLQAATTVRIKAGGNAADIAGGAGARNVCVEGLDENWDRATEVISTAGASASAVTTTTFIRVYRTFVEEAGAYGGNNVGAVIIENGSGGTDLMQINAGIGQSETTSYTIPQGHSAFITRLASHVDASKACDMIMWKREEADVILAPYGAKRIVQKFPQVIGPAGEVYNSHIDVPEKTDLWWTATTGSGGAAAVEADYDLTVVKDGYL